MMKPIDFDAIGREAFAPQTPLRPWEWAERHVDYSRAENYDTPYRGPFDASLLPFWKEPLEALHDIDTREVVVLKSSRAGYSENLILTDLRYTIAREPEPTMYVTGTMDIAKGFMDRRVKRGMSLSKETEREYRHAREVAQDIQFPRMDFRATWATSDTAMKSDGYARVYVDECSLFAEFGVDMIRRRCSAYPFHHIVYGGSIDPSRRGDPGEDPTLKLYAESDRREWVMTGPDGEEFTFQFSGLKWDQSARSGDEWDIEKAAASAYYVTPSGAEIHECDRMRIVRAGRWEARNPTGIRRGYKVVALMIPFADCTFASLVRQFLSAQGRMNDATAAGKERNSLRTYFAEFWAEPYYAKAEYASEENLADRAENYAYGAMIGDVFAEYKDAPKGVLVTVDVQKDHLWVCARQWITGGDSGLIRFEKMTTWQQVFALANDLKAERVFVDAGYSLRKAEVYEVASRTAGVVPVIGSDKIKAIYQRQSLDPYEGTAKQGKAGTITVYTINPDLFRSTLIDLMNGVTASKWMIPRGTPLEYQKQVTSTKKVIGEWKKMRRDDHAFDCETLQVFGAIRLRILPILRNLEPTQGENDVQS